MKALKLFPYQEEGVKHLTSALPASYLADKPGLGKTIQSLTAVERLGAKTLLVLCPASIVNQWQDNVRHIPKAIVASYDSIAIGTPKKEDYDTLRGLRAELLNLNHTSAEDARYIAELTRKANALERTLNRKEKAKALRKMLRDKGPYDVIICDEAHYLKERGAHRTAYVFHSQYGLVSLGKKIMLLSGTPMLNRPAELYPVLRACYPQALHDCPTFEAYGYKFCDAGWGFNGSTDYSGCSNADELGKRLEGFMLMRGTDVLGDRLPPISFIDQKVELGDSEIYIDDTEHIATRRRLTGEAKVDKLVADIRKVAGRVSKLAVFYYHEAVRKALQRVFPYAPLIKGGLTSFQKSQEIEKFVRLQSNVMLIQLGAGGVGLDGIQYVCHNGYIAELDWTPALEEQAVGRLWRLGQKDPVTIYRPVGTQQGVDERIDKLNKRKSNVISSILKTVTVNTIVSNEDNDTMASTNELEQLTRIADALEALVALQGGTVEAPAEPKAAKGGAKRGAAKPKPALTHEEVRDRIKAELNAVPSQTQTKMAAYKTMCGDWGVKNVMEVTEADLEQFLDSALTIIANAANAPAGDDEV